MLDNRNQHLYQVFNKRIKTQEARDAFDMLVDAAKASTKFRCYPQEGPVISELQFHSRDDYSGDAQQPFAFTINPKWLLFYLRKPAVASKKWSLKKLQQDFPEVNVPRDNEWTIQITDTDVAKQVIEKIVNKY